MLLRIAVAIAMTLFCAWQGFGAVSVPTETGRHYLPIVYLFVPVLLWSGLNPMGLVTWPIATILLILRGH